MDRFWTRNYPPGVPAEIDVAEYGSLIALFEESFAKHHAADAYVCLGRAMTFGEWDDLSCALASWLQAQGLARGERVAIMMPNLLQYPVAMAAVLRAGLVVVNVNPLYTARELAHQLKDSGATAIVILEDFAPTLAQVVGGTEIKHIVLCASGDMPGGDTQAERNGAIASGLHSVTRFNDAIAAGRGLKLKRHDIRGDDVAVLQYTGGTTGISKGATLLHKTIIANLLASEAWTLPGMQRKPRTGQFTIVCALPLYHVFAFITCGLLGMRLGALNILVPNPRDIAGMIATFAQHKLHMFPAVNTLFNGLAGNTEFAKLDFSELAISNGGGMKVQESVASKWLTVTGCPIIEGYGLSETSSGVTCNRADSQEYTGTIGLPLPNVEIRILDDDGQALPPGQPGEIAIRGPQVMAGYWRRDDETAAAMTADGFFKSGDIGIMDERGYTTIVDRKKDMVLVSGFNVYPNEIEEVASKHPDVLESAAIGVPDANTGEAVMLFVVRRNAALTEADLARHCAEQLTGYKKPRHIRFRDELPKSNVGKILRRALREEVLRTLRT
ncbi:AMP-binding protein [Variovorax humicola]|uniref:Long-chain-fatty-acid--CoA ligase n=1 Tax=Variovorax humicola TaxID=1769758 RepID=A0ABU8VTR6_9BURK